MPKQGTNTEEFYQQTQAVLHTAEPLLAAFCRNGDLVKLIKGSADSPPYILLGIFIKFKKKFFFSLLSHTNKTQSCVSLVNKNEKLGFSFLMEDKKREEVPKEGTTGRKEIIVEQNNEILIVYM